MNTTDCSCVDPLSDQCYLIYPGSPADMCCSGPYNRLRGEKLKATYQQDNMFKGRILLADDDMATWLMKDPSKHDLRVPSNIFDRLTDMPKRLALEYAEYYCGYNPGPLMEQERLFERIRQKNKAMKQQLTMGMLLEFQRSNIDRKGVVYMCYCHDEAPAQFASKDIVMCSHRDCEVGYFHKSCVKKLGVEKVSRWYCTDCEKQMRVVASQMLGDLDQTDSLNDMGEEVTFNENMFKKL